jgi:hypothetical protein
LPGAKDIEPALVFVVNPAVDEPIVRTGPVITPEVADQAAADFAATAPVKPQADPPTTAEAPAAKARRAEEPPIPVAEWAPTDKDIAELAAKLNITFDEVQRLVVAFKSAMATRPPAARWRPSFTAWATKNGTAALAQTAIPGT